MSEAVFRKSFQIVIPFSFALAFFNKDKTSFSSDLGESSASQLHSASVAVGLPKCKGGQNGGIFANCKNWDVCECNDWDEYNSFPESDS